MHIRYKLNCGYYCVPRGHKILQDQQLVLFFDIHNFNSARPSSPICKRKRPALCTVIVAGYSLQQSTSIRTRSFTRGTCSRQSVVVFFMVLQYQAASSIWVDILKEFARQLALILSLEQHQHTMMVQYTALCLPVNQQRNKHIQMQH
ncbi:hypothetical protein FGO68_gene1787 [Halteria grandinella]|uniref:Uncharacterized protein n=1 Tax=Halteria grandinella TaxID=5974 RepID=A0A8J8SUR4_HALGN|nr:hypothetical protein FGO68_gene1787 [Halteria grandinella]